MSFTHYFCFQVFSNCFAYQKALWQFVDTISCKNTPPKKLYKKYDCFFFSRPLTWEVDEANTWTLIRTPRPNLSPCNIIGHEATRVYEFTELYHPPFMIHELPVDTIYRFLVSLFGENDHLFFVIFYRWMIQLLQSKSYSHLHLQKE